ncbi:MAG: hypothetical protein M0D57_08575 [Sphingobacteriales bacterium JAD_PAG50586_3]|nr:MAG: hypothetical protein M0D57_08575 [Sphingobacteriales bacterium JAD_PAG50586_3]
MVGMFPAIVNMADEFNTMAIGFNQSMELKGLCKTITTINSSSWIRLADEDECKIGGGSRVKKIAFSDVWNDLTDISTNLNVTYGQEYDYTTTDGKSSGVASYEPTIGGDENPFKVPLYVAQNKIPLGPDNEFYMEGPIGESHFPSPSVGYSRVTVKNLVPADYTIATKKKPVRLYMSFIRLKIFQQ